VIQDETWPPGEVLVARCHAHRDPSNSLLLGVPHEAPGIDCACGVHAARKPASVLSYLRGRDEPGTVARVLGRVLLWGRVVEHEDGWRAERARPLDVWLPPELDGALAGCGVVERVSRGASQLFVPKLHVTAARP
jgi:hypothetical protein